MDIFYIFAGLVCFCSVLELGYVFGKYRGKKEAKDKIEMTITDYMKKKYDNREDKDNIFCVGITDAEFRKFVIEYLLGEDWYVVDPLGQTQVNEVALAEILSKYSKRFKKEIKPLRSIRRWE